MLFAIVFGFVFMLTHYRPWLVGGEDRQREPGD